MPRKTLQQCLEEKHILVLDGGISTHLESMQKDDSFPDRNLWSSSLLLTDDGKKDIQRAHQDFLSAGSDVITTVTYQLSDYVEKFGYSRAKIDTMMSDAVQLCKSARDAVNQNAYVVGSIGCYGGALADGSEYTGDYGDMTIDDLMSFHKRKTEQLISLSVDGVAFETIPSFLEVKAILRLMKEIRDEVKSNDIYVWMSLACQNEYLLNDGTAIEDVLHYFNNEDPNASVINGVGVNCCKLKYVHGLCQALTQSILHSRVRRAIILYPNSGEEWDAVNCDWIKDSGCQSSQTFALKIKKYLETIHNMCEERNQDHLPILVGGCCRVKVEDIASVKIEVDRFVKDKL
ncbi:hypothetical protein CTEN210_11956 [Chaetoceros tenuissimus]|uniref:Hcy-binding domain-containing protein n=1 Tax=Chaetoceros tenuissimus TaxID=426638 RepID=A0AAD3D2R4_9STRA|nr:hypothetical protein CTEN210_11956 [Chaetoceros tenuissimus]